MSSFESLSAYITLIWDLEEAFPYAKIQQPKPGI
jgi:hypothetical protein